MSTFQIVLVVLAGLLVLSSFSGFGTLLKEIFAAKPVDEDKNIDVKKPVVDVPEQLVPECNLLEMVEQWEKFHDAAHEEALHEICDELDKIFPMLLEVHKNKHHVVNPTSKQVTKGLPHVRK